MEGDRSLSGKSPAEKKSPARPKVSEEDKAAREAAKEAEKEEKRLAKEKEREEARLAKEKEKEGAKVNKGQEKLAAKAAEEEAKDAAMVQAVTTALAPGGSFQEAFDVFGAAVEKLGYGPEYLRAERILEKFVGTPRFDEFFFQLAAAQPALRSWRVVDALLQTQLSPVAFKYAVYFCTSGGAYRGKEVEGDSFCKSIMASRLAAQCTNADRDELDDLMETLVTSVANAPRQVKAPRWNEPVLYALPADLVLPEDAEWKHWDTATTEGEGVPLVQQAWLASIRRIECLLKLLAAVHGDGGRFTLGGATCNVGKKPKGDNFAMCHSSVIAGLTREGPGGKKESTRVQLWFGTKLIHDLNRTVNMPAKINSVDTCMERTCGMREELQAVVNHVSGSVCVPQLGDKTLQQLWVTLVKKLEKVSLGLSSPDSKENADLTPAQRIYASIQHRACTTVLHAPTEFVTKCLTRDGIASHGAETFAEWRRQLLAKQ